MRKPLDTWKTKSANFALVQRIATSGSVHEVHWNALSTTYTIINLKSGFESHGIKYT